MSTEEDNTAYRPEPLQYSVGEVCKCYFTEIHKNYTEDISQQINKCQSYCRVVEKNPEDTKEYSVMLFNGLKTIKKLPGCCLRKVRLVPYTYKEACEKIGDIIESNDNSEDPSVSMMVSIVENGTEGEDVEVNNFSVKELAETFHYRYNDAPFCNIKMLHADEVGLKQNEQD